MDVSIIMINYNTYELTKNAIESIISNTRHIEYEIILVDNNSPDKSGEMLAAVFGEKICFIQSGCNYGTSKAFNLGMKKARGKYVLWLNTDILVNDNSIYTLYEFMENNSDCGICGANLYDFNHKPTHSYLNKLPSLKTIKRSLSLFYMIWNKIFQTDIKKQFNFCGKPIEVGYITGADMMIRKSVIDTIGGFDEDIFMYAEESEFTFRMKKKTYYKVYSVPTAKIQHLEGASFGDKTNFNERRFIVKLNGNCIYFKKCYGCSETINYLKILKRGYCKMEIFNKAIFRFQKSRDYKRMRKIIKKKLKEESEKL